MAVRLIEIPLKRIDRTTRNREEAKRKKRAVAENMRKWKEDS
jgi:hypothetical protein